MWLGALALDWGPGYEIGAPELNYSTTYSQCKTRKEDAVMLGEK